MRTHPRHCKSEQPCKDEHSYYCKACAELFLCDETTHHRNPAGIVLPNGYWPYCSLECYVTYFGDSDPNDFLIEVENPGEHEEISA